MNDATISMVAVVLLVSSSTTGAYAATHLAVNHGGSMEPTLCDNSVLLVDRDATPHVGDIVALDTGKSMTYHRLVNVDGQDLIIRGDHNPHESHDMVYADEVPRGPDLERPDPPLAYPHRTDVLGVVSAVLYDGCGSV